LEEHDMSRHHEILGALVACLIVADARSASAASLNAAGSHGRMQPVQLAAPVHLYVAVIGAKSGKVIRYPFVNGLPSKKADFVYRGITSPIAVDAHGTLYGESNICCFCVAHIDTWPAGSPKPTAHVKVPWVSSDGAIGSSVAVDGSGYLYVGYAQCLSGLRGAQSSSRASSGPPATGIAVYAPNQNGGPPVATFDVPNDDSAPESMVFGPDGDLYVSVSTYSNGNYVEVVANPRTDPKVVREISFGSLNVYSMTFGRRDLYALTSAGRPTAVDVLKADANGPAKPIRTIELPFGSETLWGGLALYGPDAFSIMTNFTYSDTTIEEFPASASGETQPNPVISYVKHTVAGDLTVGP
jgi:hypothetical protein